MKNTELLNSQLNANETDKENSSKLVERENIDETPFTIIDNEEGSFLVIGKYRVSEVVTNRENLKKMIEGVNWEILTAVIGIMVEEINSHKNK